MTTVVKVPASPAVIEFQKLNARINGKISQASSNRAYWVSYYDKCAKEICSKYEISISDLVDSWFSWVNAVEQAQKGGK